MQCKVCKTELKKHPRITFKQFNKQEFCSVDCRGEWDSVNRRGRNNSNWKGGITTENNLLRTNRVYKRWRDNVFRRDDWTCQSCGTRGASLNAHHIKEWAKNKKERFNLDNGITLCVDCHIIIHNNK